ncbi:MAG: hypothetical protein H0Z40_01370 [Desulfotomaculum sp.]|nr:hypothetical protein [Desulfotomaculum sp.]
MYKLRPRDELVVILDDLDFSWHEEEINRVVDMWNEGYSISEIVREIRPPRSGLKTKRDAEDEVALLIFHLAREGRIEPRPGGVWGKEDPGYAPGRKKNK